MAPALVNCQTQTKKSQLLAPQDFEVKMSQVKNYTLLDVRTQEEYDKGHLADATLMDFYNNNFKKELSKLDKAKPVFVYCAVGGRSGSTAKALIDMGFTEVYDLRGGMESWVKAKKKVVK
jgi:rhodanese-related sulfurtransferase